MYDKQLQKKAKGGTASNKVAPKKEEEESQGRNRALTTEGPILNTVESQSQNSNVNTETPLSAFDSHPVRSRT